MDKIFDIIGSIIMMSICAFYGACLGFVVWCLQCICQNNGEVPPTALLLCAGVGAIIGWILDKQMREEREEKARQEELLRQQQLKEQEEKAKEKARQEELLRQQQLKEQEEVKYNNWYYNLSGKYNNIVNTAWSMDTTFNPASYYEQIFTQFNVKTSERDGRYIGGYEQCQYEHIQCLKNNLFDVIANMNKLKDIISIRRAINLLCCLDYIDNNEVTKKALDVMNDIFALVQLPLLYLEEKTYGDFNFPLDDSNVFQETKQIMERGGANQFYTYLNQLHNSGNNLITMIAEGELLNFLQSTVKAMWYYAKLKPFDVSNFNLSIDLVNKYTLNNGISKVEVILAKIYSKNQLGGKEVVRQELKVIEEWVGNVKNFSHKECILLASGLAWMELYEIELYFLRKFVEMGIQLPENVQERLSFLENGGTADIKVYQIEPSSDFMFDSDSLDWNTKDYSIFFRKLSMKKMDMNYSLAHTKWTKTLPLASGQKISFEELYHEFVKLADDFDGEITCETALAKAVNLKNLEYPNATIFRFVKERNRCISVLVSCEKYGRNLNTTIITMFTPDNSIEVDELEQYCQAIKNNRYVESFRESISQVIDTVLNPVQSTYGDIFE